MWEAVGICLAWVAAGVAIGYGGGWLIDRLSRHNHERRR